MPNLSFVYIYMDAIYMFAAFIWLLLYVLSFAYMCLGMLQAVILHHQCTKYSIAYPHWPCLKIVSTLYSSPLPAARIESVGPKVAPPSEYSHNSET